MGINHCLNTGVSGAVEGLGLKAAELSRCALVSSSLVISSATALGVECLSIVNLLEHETPSSLPMAKGVGWDGVDG